MGLLTTLRFIVNHPLNEGQKSKAILRFIKWQLNTRLNQYPVVYPFTDRSRLIVKKGMTGATGNIYTGLHEFNDMCFLLHFLRKEDLFIDIGANVGTYTILAGAHVGAQVISVEPVPGTFNHLLDNIKINGIQDKATPLNVALGAKPGVIDFTSMLDTVNHVATKDDKDIIQVEVQTADSLLSDRAPVAMKIDVEGFETEVINGAQAILDHEALKAIIIELNGSGKRYGYDEMDIHRMLVKKGFLLYVYDPAKRKLTSADQIGTHNTIYVRDFDFVNQRLQDAEVIKIRGRQI